MNDLRYPVGKFDHPQASTPEERREFLLEIAACPGKLRRAVAGLSAEQLATPYRDGGWTVRQVAHHVPDSHMNAYIRHKLAVTEEVPTIRPYEEGLWAELPDGRDGELEPSLVLLEVLHDRWCRFLNALAPADFTRTFRHPALPGPVSLDWSVGMYAWHGRHHVGHIVALRQRRGW